MVQATTIKFLKGLAANNNKPWFDEHRKEYAAAKANHEQIVEEILSGLSKVVPELEGQTVKESIFRIFRDVRFAKDKTPYKSHFGAFLSRGGRKFEGAGYYLHIEPDDKSFVEGGLWMPSGPLLKAVRQEIDYNYEEFLDIIEEKSFKKAFGKINGEQLKTIPQGYTADNAAIDYLKLKSFTVGHQLTDKELTHPDFEKKSVELFTLMKPFIEFLNRAFD